jgi:DNA polymerase III epsilon subunit-like protein
MVKIRIPKPKIDVMNLIFDTETTGTYPKDWAWRVDYMKFPYIVSMAWKYKGKAHYYLIHQEGRKVPKESTAIHGITTEMGNNDSVCKPFKWVAELLIKDLLQAGNIIGHSVFFDSHIFKANVLREFGPDSLQAISATEGLDKSKCICTMRGSKSLFNNKWPKLTVLHEYLFKQPFAAHDALEDVLACERCFYELRKRKVL